MKHKLIIALDNSDRGYEIIADILTESKLLLDGIERRKKEQNVEQIIFYIPEAMSSSADTREFERAGIEIRYGIVDVRESGVQDVIVHPEELLGGKVRRLVACISGTTVVRRVSSDISVKEAVRLLYGDAEEVKAWRAGEYCLKPSELSKFRVADLGSACLMPIGQSACMVETAKEQAEYLYSETCGKCTFCRESSYQTRTVLREIVLGKGQAEDPAYIKELAGEAAEETMCTFGQRGFQFLKDCVSKFEKDYIEHIKYQNCPQEVCKSFTDIAIHGGRCTGCGKCAEICPEKAVFGAGGYIHFIDTYDCSQCEKCISECPEKAIQKVRRGRKIGPLQMVPAGRYRTVLKKYKKEGTAC